MIKFYRDVYGGSASIREYNGHFILKARTSNGDIYHHKNYKTFKGARIALGKITEGFVQEVGR